MRKHRVGKQLLIVLCVVLIVFLAGCRPSPILEQIIYEHNHEVNEDTETKEMNDDPENEEPDENIPSRETVEDSEQIKDQEHTAALAGDSDTSEEPDAVYDVAYNPSGDLSEPDETNPTEGSASEKATGSTEAGGDEGGNTPSGEEGEESGTEGLTVPDSNGGSEAGEEPDGGEKADADDGPKAGDEHGPEETTEPKQILDATGEYVEVPQNVGTVTAVGEAATIVEVLGGNNRLLASSNSFKTNTFAEQAFASQGFYNVYEWWDGDGSTSACNNMKGLLEAHPDVCFEISGQDTFSSDQIAALNEEGIAYVLLWPLNSIDHIKDDVTLVGQVLGNNADYGIDSESKAKTYCDWVNNVINQSSGGSEKATVYIARWDGEAQWRIYSNTDTLASGLGAPVGMQSIGVFNNCLSYVNMINTAVDNYYVEPVRGLAWRPDITNASGRYNSNVRTIYSNTLGVGLGNAAFPAVIVADSETRDKILSDPYFYYHWRTGYSTVVNNTSAFGFDDGTEKTANGNLITTWIAGSYTVLVNPSGLGSWTGGSMESPLEVAWLACKFQKSVSESQLRGWVSEFYNTFYNGYNVDPSDIMPGDIPIE